MNNQTTPTSTDEREATAITAETVASQLPFSFAKRHGVLLGQADRLYCRDDVSLQAIAEAQRWAGKVLNVEHLNNEAFGQQLSTHFEQDSSTAMQMVEELGEELDLDSLARQMPTTEDLLEQQDDAPIIKLINALLTEALKLKASDIHIESFESQLVVRFRIDGVLREIVRPRRELAPLLVSRIKVMSRMDIAEKRVPQDGRMSLKIGGRDLDVRVSTLPASNGERVVMRLLDKQAGRLGLNGLGMLAPERKTLEALLQRPHGIILITGPTGSGKTTSLYAGLGSLDREQKNILTVEDPVEYNLEGIGQTQVNSKADMTFARGLRAILRQDPDVVMVGEIRDLETVEIAIQASLTGHLVLSTLHTNTAVGAVTRLMDMGVEPFLLSSSLVGVAAQRLVRILCESCKTPYTPTTRERRLLQVAEADEPTIYHANGCDACNQTGYSGRRGIYEIISIDDTLRKLIHDRAAERELLAHARTISSGIRENGCQLVLSGQTCTEEILRVTQED